MSCTPQPADLSLLIPLETWQPYKEVVDLFNSRGIRFAAGGGLAFSRYSARLRYTKDIDFFLAPEFKDRARQATTELGFEDYFGQEEYDRSWIYRGYRDDVIVDLIWTAPNHRMLVDDGWVTGGPTVTVHGTQVQVLRLEEFLWSKLYVMQRDRCDWPDMMNVLYSCGENIDWDLMLERLGPDAPLMGAMLASYRWLAPERAAKLPGTLWEKVGLTRNWPETSSEWSVDRVHLLDTRDWFGPKASAE